MPGLQVTVPLACVQPAGKAETKAAPAGNVSVITTVVASAGPLLVTVSAYVSALPATTGSGASIIASARSASVADPDTGAKFARTV